MMPEPKPCPYGLCVETAGHSHGTDVRYLPRVAEATPYSDHEMDDFLAGRPSPVTIIQPHGIADIPAAEPTKQREGDQALPKPGKVCVQDLVIARMEESKRVGMERYGSTLQTFNGRRGIQDVAEEVRDLFVYLTQIEEEAKADRETLIAVAMDAVREQESYFGLAVQAVTETVVDAIMGWVVGQRSAAPQ